MSPLCQVSSLQMCCLHLALTEIHQGLSNGHKKSLHKFLVATLHGGIRQQLIDLAVNKYQNDLYSLMDIIGSLSDSAIRRIEPRPDKLCLSVSQLDLLFSRLEEYGVTGLHELIVKVELSQREPVSSAVTSNGVRSLHNLLSNGLAQNLRVLVLRAACDNEVLNLLGQHAVNLMSLDISSNWRVDDLGIRHLILKDPGCLSFPPDLDSCESNVLCELATLPQNLLTPVCFSLHEIRIQDTNTSGLSVLMLLLFIKNLKSLGGFIYYRNIGDAILTLQPYRSQLELTDLWDMHLPPDKVLRLSSALPKLATLYTRASQLPQGLTPFENLINMTIDFDFAHFGPQFTEYLSFNGSRLKKVILIDQVYSLDLTTVAYCCPLLTELEAKVRIGDHYPSALMPYLKVARLRISSAETFRWLMLHAEVIQHLELLMEEDEELHYHGLILDHKVIVDLSNCQPPSFDTIEYLSIYLINSYVGSLDSDSIRLLISSCKHLKYLDDLQTWCRVREAEILSVVSEMVTNNCNIDMRYKDYTTSIFSEFYNC
ncbi:uncharacterized protein LOC142333053 isoform X2 [Lycorma delicatula]|uniref:uncharacterized protein LOC142333053 isoform X2 n=1 Tax=Lycorma delicatula TaxID=130591 RepID=UPI003F510531